MDRTPLYRQTWIVALVVAALFGAAYYWLLSAAGESAIPTSFFSDLILVFGILTLLTILVFSLNIFMTSASDSKVALSIFLRIIFFLSVLFAHVPMFLSGGSESFLRVILVDFDSMLLLLMLFLAFTAQFVLPVESWTDRMAAIRRLYGYVLGERGPITFIRLGKTIEAHEESNRRGPGVFIVDHSSAIVLRTDVQFTRAVGPGLVFTSPGERIAEALDLRRQLRTVRGEVPAKGPPTEPEAMTSLALTQDGIPVSADLSVTFMLHPGHSGNPREGNDPKLSPYEFSKRSAERAVYGHLFGDTDDLPWTELPLLLVTDLWREEVKSQRLNSLISYVHDSPAPLEIIRNSILRKLTLEPFVGSERPEEKSEAFRESDVLRERGIRVLDVSIKNLKLPDDVRHEQNLRWQQKWAGEVQVLLSDAMDRVHEERRLGWADADASLLKDLTDTLGEVLEEGKTPGRRDSIGMVIGDAARFSVREGAVRDPITLSSQLNRLRENIASMDDNCQDPGGQV